MDSYLPEDIANILGEADTFAGQDPDIQTPQSSERSSFGVGPERPTTLDAALEKIDDLQRRIYRYETKLKPTNPVDLLRLQDEVKAKDAEIAELRRAQNQARYASGFTAVARSVEAENKVKIVELNQ